MINKRAAAQHLTSIEGSGAHPGRVRRTALRTPWPYRRDICAPGPCIPLSLGSCPEHLDPSHPRDGDCPLPGPALRQAINIPPNFPSSLKPLAPRQWPRSPWSNPEPQAGAEAAPASLSQRDARGCSEPQGWRDIPAGSPRDTGRLAALFFKLIPSHPLRLSFNLQEFKTTWQDRQDLYINPGGHFVKQTLMSKWPLYLECGFMQVTGQQSSCPLSLQHNGDSRDAISTIFFLPCCVLKNLF